MIKKIVIFGTGAQGSTVASKLSTEDEVAEIVCADYDIDAAEKIVSSLKKGVAMQVDANNKDELIKAAHDADLIINALPLDFGVNVLQAALEVGANYQDFAVSENVVNLPDSYSNWLEGIKVLRTDYDKKFKEAGKLALICTGSAPGLMCVIARKTVAELDSCDTINMLVYEGLKSKRFVPFWWSPYTALCDMQEDAYAFENEKMIRTKPFSRPLTRNWPETGKDIVFVEHCHDEPPIMGLNSKKYFKGAKNIYFKYAGTGIDFARPLYEAGMLTHEEELIGNCKISPIQFVLSHVPPAPKFADTIKDIIDEGLISDEGAFVCECFGKKDGKDVLVETHVYAPGLVDAYKKRKMSSEMYLTGQCGFFFTKLFFTGKLNQKGLISSDMLTEEQNNQYLHWAEEAGITYEINVKYL